jgi:hypothetical protein
VRFCAPLSWLSDLQRGDLVHAISPARARRRARLAVVVTAMTAVVTVAGCRPPDHPVNPPRPSAEQGLIGAWTVTGFVHGATQQFMTAIPRPLTVEFDGNRVSWERCDPFEASYETNGRHLAIGPVTVPDPIRDHARGCAGDIDDLDEGLAATMPRATWWQRVGDRLTLSEGRGGRVLLTATLPPTPGPRPPDPGPPCDPAIPACAHDGPHGS